MNSITVFSFLVRGLIYAIAALFALILAAYIYVLIPQSMGDLHFAGASVVSGDVLKRLNENFSPWESVPRRMLRIELTSDFEIISRSVEIGGSENPPTALGSKCPLDSSDRNFLRTHGPFPDDLSQYFSDRYKMRRSIRQLDGRYHYTIYIDANDRQIIGNNLCIKFQGSWYFSPHGETGIITISQNEIKKVLAPENLDPPLQGEGDRPEGGGGVNPHAAPAR